MAECELDLLERRLAGAGELGEGTAQIVRRQLPAELTRMGSHHIGDGVRKLLVLDG